MVRVGSLVDWTLALVQKTVQSSRTVVLPLPSEEPCQSNLQRCAHTPVRLSPQWLLRIPMSCLLCRGCLGWKLFCVGYAAPQLAQAKAATFHLDATHSYWKSFRVPPLAIHFILLRMPEGHKNAFSLTLKAPISGLCPLLHVDLTHTPTPPSYVKPCATKKH